MFIWIKCFRKVKSCLRLDVVPQYMKSWKKNILKRKFLYYRKSKAQDKEERRTKFIVSEATCGCTSSGPQVKISANILPGMFALYQKSYLRCITLVCYISKIHFMIMWINPSNTILLFHFLLFQPKPGEKPIPGMIYNVLNHVYI